MALQPTGIEENCLLSIMLDLETMSTRSDAAIISIGAVKFVAGDESASVSDFYCAVSLKSSQNAGLHIDAETVLWWMKQSEEARKALTHGNELNFVLNQFSLFAKGVEWLWGNGATFDNVVLRNAYRATRVNFPITYKGDMCYRTLKSLHPNVPFTPMGTKHNALDDAKAQMEHLQRIFKEAR